MRAVPRHSGRFISRVGSADPIAVVRRAGGWIVARDAVEVVEASGTEALAALDDLTPGWWAGALTFELGDACERVRRGESHRPELPGLVLVRFRHRAAIAGDAPLPLPASDERGARHFGPPQSSLDQAGYEAAVGTALDHIVAGDFYQVNLTRRLTWPAPVDPVALFLASSSPTPAPHAALLQLPVATGGSLAVVSASPERFLAWNGRAVETRPIKGTARDPAVLAASAKDRAENVMIVDLARNDLGRVCVPGSIHVPELCAIERHPGLVHLVSTVRGQRRPASTLRDLIAATYPPASVTGAPKPRVLQAIADAEPVPRGVYCGAVGWIDTARDAGDLAVAIRTFTITDDATTFGTGAGIVADSDPAREWDETELKAERFVQMLAARPAAAVPA